MTEHLPPPRHVDDPHLNDDVLSSALDAGPTSDESAHMGACTPCAQRFDALAKAAALVARGVPPLDPEERDAMLAAAINSRGGSLGSVRGVPVDLWSRKDSAAKRRSLPPLAVMAGIAAALIALVGVGTLLPRPANDSQASLEVADSPSADSKTQEAGNDGGSDSAGALSASALDPELVSADLGSYDDAESLTLALQAAGASAGASAAPSGVAATGAAASGRSTTDQEATAELSASAGARAMCTARALDYGGGRLGALVSTSTVRWKGSPAEVLLFVLPEPASGFSRQAMVLSRPGCELLADPRF